MESVKYKGLPRIVPWATEDEWRYVWSSLFASAENLEAKFEGVCLVKAWRTRGKVPHAVEATCDLVDVLLSDFQLSSIKDSMPEKMDERPHLAHRFIVDEYQLRQIYALSLVRFVNGFADNAQKSQNAKSVYQLAQAMKIPSWFVDLRHSATHDPHLPMLSVLRTAVSRALNWLELNYWKQREVDRVSKPQRIMQAFSKLLNGSDQDVRVRTSENAALINKCEHAAFLSINDACGTDMMSDDVVPILASFSFLLRDPSKTLPIETACSNRWNTFKRLIKRIQGLHTPFVSNLVAALIENVISVDADYARSSLHGEIYRKKVALCRNMLSTMLLDEWIQSLQIWKERVVRGRIGEALKHWRHLASQNKPHQSAKATVDVFRRHVSALQPVLDPCYQFIELTTTSEVVRPTGLSVLEPTKSVSEICADAEQMQKNWSEMVKTASQIPSDDAETLPMFIDSSAFVKIDHLPSDAEYVNESSPWQSVASNIGCIGKYEHIPGTAIGSNPDGTPSQLYMFKREQLQ